VSHRWRRCQNCIFVWSLKIVGWCGCRKYLEQPCAMLLNNMTAVRTMSTNAEIFIGFLLIFLFLTSVSFSFLYMFLLLLLHWVHGENGKENTHFSMDLNAPLICDA